MILKSNFNVKNANSLTLFNANFNVNINVNNAKIRLFDVICVNSGVFFNVFSLTLKR